MMNRVEGHERIYIGGLDDLSSSTVLDEAMITHILTIQAPNTFNPNAYVKSLVGREHQILDLDDEIQSDLMEHIPAMVRFIDGALYPGNPAPEPASPTWPASPVSSSSGPSRPQTANNPPPSPAAAVLVHCTMGRSRSPAAVIAWLMHRHPQRCLVPLLQNRNNTGNDATEGALNLINRSRRLADPNEGFMKQLAMWWEIGCPLTNMNAHEAYRQWALKKRASWSGPHNFNFEISSLVYADEAASAPPFPGEMLLRCRACQETLVVAGRGLLRHRRRSDALLSPTHRTSEGVIKVAEGQEGPQCSHHWIEPVRWMRATLEKNEPSGYLNCPGCETRLGQYSFDGIECECGQMQKPGMGLLRRKVVEDVVKARSMLDD